MSIEETPRQKAVETDNAAALSDAVRQVRQAAELVADAANLIAMGAGSMPRNRETPSRLCKPEWPTF